MTKNIVMHTLVLRYMRRDGKIITQNYGLTPDLPGLIADELDGWDALGSEGSFIWIETVHDILAINSKHLVSANILTDIGLRVCEADNASVGGEDVDVPLNLYFDCADVAPASPDGADWLALDGPLTEEILDLAQRLDRNDALIALDDGDGEPLFFNIDRLALMVIDKAFETDSGRPIGALLANRLNIEIGRYEPDLDGEALPLALSFEDLAQLEPRLVVLRQEVMAIHDDATQPYFCANKAWFAPDGPKHILMYLVGARAEKDDQSLRLPAAYRIAYQTLYDLLPDCRGCSCA